MHPRPKRSAAHTVTAQVWDEKASLPTGYGAALLAQWATSQAQA
jgi:hypothetical protein